MQIDKNYQHHDVAGTGGGGLTATIDKRAKMLYTNLAELRIDPDEQCSFYAVIIDAGHPYRHQQHNRYICTMKVVDQTLHSTVESAQGKL